MRRYSGRSTIRHFAGLFEGGTIREALQFEGTPGSMAGRRGSRPTERLFEFGASKKSRVNGTTRFEKRTRSG